MRKLDLILASASPRRAALLRTLGLDPRVVPSGIAETTRPGESPSETVRRLASEKAAAIASTVAAPSCDGAILAADTAVVLRDEILGKPTDDADATRMLRILSGRSHRVVTGVWVRNLATKAESHDVAVTRVRFRELHDRLIEWYVASGEPRDKAGAYGIQERGALLVESIEGSWSNVVGLPLEKLPGLFCRIGLDLF